MLFTKILSAISIVEVAIHTKAKIELKENSFFVLKGWLIFIGKNFKIKKSIIIDELNITLVSAKKKNTASKFHIAGIPE